MKQRLKHFPQRYAAALEKHLKCGPQASLQPALALGREAIALKLDTLALARIHEEALATYGLSNTKNGFTKLAALFFNEANLPIEETHRSARQGKARLSQLVQTLGQRTKELAASNRQVQRAATRRKVMEQAFVKSGTSHDKCLEESLELQKRLRQLTHKVLLAQEDERKKISHELQDEIAQTLLGINVRLLSLKHQDRLNTNGIQDNIASTQLLVAKSEQSVRQFASELHTQQPAISAKSVSTT
jgi:signal transduction histidine kinase